MIEDFFISRYAPISSTQSRIDESGRVFCLLRSWLVFRNLSLTSLSSSWRVLFSVCRNRARTSADGSVWSRPKPLWTNEETGIVSHVITLPNILNLFQTKANSDYLRGAKEILLSLWTLIIFSWNRFRTLHHFRSYPHAIQRKGGNSYVDLTLITGIADKLNRVTV